MILDPRLSACAEFVDNNSIVCDIGTDHGYLPVYLVQQNIAIKAIAGDIGVGPLDAAKQNIEKYRLSNKIKTVLSDGLKNIEQNDITHIVIAGMGGETIRDIISACDWAKTCDLILQPMTKSETLRKWLYENGYDIIGEKAVTHDKFIYTVMKCRFSGNIKNASSFDITVGGLDLNQTDSIKYVEKKISILKKSADGKLKSQDLVQDGQDDLKLARELSNALNIV